jgi:hypothetical protein
MTDKKWGAYTGWLDRDYLEAHFDKFSLEPVTGCVTPGKRTVHGIAILNLVLFGMKSIPERISRLNQHATSVGYEAVEPLKLFTRRRLVPKNTETVAQQEDNIKACVSWDFIELLVADCVRDFGDAMITQLLVSFHDRDARVRRQRTGKNTVPTDATSNVQDAKFLSVAETVADERLLFRTQGKKIAAREFTSATIDTPKAETHIAVGSLQLVKHCLSKGTHYPPLNATTC